MCVKNDSWMKECYMLLVKGACGRRLGKHMGRSGEGTGDDKGPHKWGHIILKLTSLSHTHSQERTQP